MLNSAISFINHFLNWAPNFAALSLPLRAYAATKQGVQKLNWEDKPEMAKQYMTLVEAMEMFSGLEVLPTDLNRIQALLMASDACQSTIAYNIGIALKPLKEKKDPTGKMGKLIMRLVSHYSKRLDQNIINS